MLGLLVQGMYSTGANSSAHQAGAAGHEWSAIMCDHDDGDPGDHAALLVAYARVRGSALGRC